MAFKPALFQERVTELTQLPTRELAQAFWDLETQPEFGGQEAALAIVTSALAGPLGTVAPAETARVAHVVRRVLAIGPLPAAVRVEILVRFVDAARRGALSPRVASAALEAADLLESPDVTINGAGRRPSRRARPSRRLGESRTPRRLQACPPAIAAEFRLRHALMTGDHARAITLAEEMAETLVTARGWN